MTESTTVKRSTYIILAAVVVVWGASWPVMKWGIQFITPLWFAVARLAIGVACWFAYVLMTKQLCWPKRSDWPVVISVGALQMGLFLVFVNEGLRYVGAGRAAMLCYTVPFWVTPFAVKCFGEPMNRLKLWGLICGMGGILGLFNPLSFDWHNPLSWLGNGLMLLAALSWAVAILHTRYGRWESSIERLIPWQLLLGTLVCIPLALWLEPQPTIHWGWPLFWVLMNTGVLCSAFAYWGAIVVARQMPSVTASLWFLGVPVLGLLVSAATLGEDLTLTEGVAMLFILVGLVLVAKAPDQQDPQG